MQLIFPPIPQKISFGNRLRDKEFVITLWQFTKDLESFQAGRKSLLNQINALLDKWLSRRLSVSPHPF